MVEVTGLAPLAARSGEQPSAQAVQFAFESHRYHAFQCKPIATAIASNPQVTPQNFKT